MYTSDCDKCNTRASFCRFDLKYLSKEQSECKYVLLTTLHQIPSNLKGNRGSVGRTVIYEL